MKREANMAGGLFSSKRFLLLMIVFLMAGTVLFLTLSQSTAEVNKSTHLQQNVVVGEPKKNAGYLIKDQLPADERITEKPIQRKIEIPVHKPAVRRKNIVDNSGAMLYLQQYRDLFDARADLSNVDPNKNSTIVKWWQAAAMIDWYIHSPIRYKCENRVAVGNWHICQDSKYTIKPPCLVYSFGINFDFSFDDAMTKLGCEVHSFDPSMDKETHRRENNSTFHNLGLSNTNTDGFLPRKDGYVNKPQVWKMRTLKSVMKELGHEEKVIDVLKIDIEGHEWAVIDNMMETGVFKYVRQFMLEFHLFPDWPVKEDYVNLYQIYTRLREMGFSEYAVGPHPKTLKEDKFNNQGDSEYVNIFFEQNNNLEL
ncbi:uncharacterized protein LOC106054816 isoform X1 [Biomphalaria glabrata]|uniref:Uncharacterized protein LOC106054816 isoform X1 n=2 Tax=Biomphalaria glabrata TaxID=6526 RepID=A0A9U8DYB5_BIOGL|nr:uncharacterized protein LOC106054816 isoform X1 [Biomphalaria glabrata]